MFRQLAVEPRGNYREGMRTLALALALALTALAGCHQPAPKKPNAAEPAAEPGMTKGVDRNHHGKPAPDTLFLNPDGGSISLAKFRGAPVLVNFWATWCAPCVKELPTLDKVAAAHRADGSIAVVAINQDNGPQVSVKAFLTKLNVHDLAAYQDLKMKVSGALGAEVLPTSILFDAQGNEVWRYVGDLDWTSTEAARLLAEAPGDAPKAG